MKRLKIWAFLFAVAALGACQKEDSTGHLSVRMTDDPADYLEVNVEVLSVDIHYEDNSNSGWVSLPTNQGIYDLLDLQNDVSVVIADQEDLPVGQLSQLRLLLGQNNTLVTTTGIYPLLLSSQDKTGLKINLNTEMLVDQHLEILLDFDAGKSVVEEGNGSYRLKPVIRVESINYIPE